MASPPQKSALPIRWRWPGAGAFLLLALLAWRLPPNGEVHARIAQFFGRFHPLIIHLPIGLILLVPVLELAGAARPRTHLRAATQFVLWLAVLTAFGAAFDGWLLAWSGGYKGALVARHLWGGVAVAGLSLATACVRSASASPPPDGRAAGSAYPLLLAGLLVLLTRTSDQGGKLSHGENFLVQYMPGRVRTWLRISPAPTPRAAVPAAPSSASGTLYARRIQPLFDRSCVSCHGPEKVKGGLRLDTYAQLMRGGENGAAVEPWRPEQSDLLRRITLSPDDDDFMPSNNKNLLDAAEVKIIRQWIAGGASDREPANVILP
jgi:uncharacterized membrane protein